MAGGSDDVYRKRGTPHRGAVEKAHIPVILVMNKIDTVKKEELLACIDAYQQIMEFDEIVPVSAWTGESVDHLVDVMFRYLEEGPAFYDDDTVTDQPVRQIVAELIREKALRLLADEIPHGIAVAVDQMKLRHNNKKYVRYRRDNHLRAGFPQGDHHRKAGSDAEKRSVRRRGVRLKKCFRKKVNLKLWVKVKKDWRDSDFLFEEFWV